MTEVRAHYLRAFEALRDPGPPWLLALRRAAMERFLARGFPSTREEEWRLTNLAPVATAPFPPAPRPPAPPPRESVERLLPRGPVSARLVFADGHFVPSLSTTEHLPDGAYAGSLMAAVRDRPSLVEPHLPRDAEDAFEALNGALFEDGAFVHLPRGCCLVEPIYVLHLSRTDGALAVPRNLVVAGESSHATVLEVHAGEGGGGRFLDAVTRIEAEANASVEHALLQEEAAATFAFERVATRQARDTNLVSHLFLFGGALARAAVRAELGGEGAAATLYGLYLADGTRHVDANTRIEHVAPRCNSREVYKGILDGKSTAVFRGRIHVHPPAQQTDAKQSNDNLLLSRDAVVDAQPQLEIYANDVKCTHGATIGKLEDDALFYLRARGLDEPDARAVLVEAFANDVTEKVRSEPIRRHVEALLLARLPGARGREWTA
jgi:Fe-S cluster assembly protein SufD